MITLRIDNTYEDGHESFFEVTVPAPAGTDEDALETWWEETVFNETGDGHGAAFPKLGACHTATVVEAEEMPELVGQEREWC